MPLDAYMKLTDAHGTFVAGEGTDEILRRWIALTSFGFGDGTASDDDEKKNEAQGQAPPGGAPAQGKGAPTVPAPQAPPPHGTSKPPKSEKLVFTIGKELDSSSPILFLAFCRSQVFREPVTDKANALNTFKTAVIDLRKTFDGQPRPYLVCTFKDVSLVSYKLQYDDGSSSLRENIQFKFASYEVEYKMQSAAGGVAQAQVVVGSLPGNKSQGGA
jgi:type VI protein secretion system component Hcp